MKLGSALSELAKLKRAIYDIANEIFVDKEPVGFLSHSLVNDRNRVLKKRLMDLSGGERQTPDAD